MRLTHRNPSTDMRSPTTALLPGQARSTGGAGGRVRRRIVGLLAVVAMTGLGPLSMSATALARDVVQPGRAVTASVSSVRQTNWVVPLSVTCGGPTATTCRGRLSLVVKVRYRQTGKQSTLVLGTRLYAIKVGTKQTLRITLNPRGRSLLASHTWLKVRVRLTPTARGGGVAMASRTIITLRAPAE